MSSTSYTGTHSLSPVIPFPRPIASRAALSAEIAAWFDLAVGAIERGMDILAVAAGSCIAHWMGTMRIHAEATRYSTSAVVATAIGFGLLVMLLLDKLGDYRRDISLLAVRETERLLRVAVLGIPLGLTILFALTRTLPLDSVLPALVLVPVLLVSEKRITQGSARLLRQRLGFTRKAVIVGTGSLGRKVFSTLVRSPKLGIDP